MLSFKTRARALAALAFALSAVLAYVPANAGMVLPLQRQLAARLSKAAGIAGRPQSAPQAAENLFARP